VCIFSQEKNKVGRVQTQRHEVDVCGDLGSDWPADVCDD
jgi:hypothetical protein